MRPIRPNTRRRPLWHTVLLAILAIAIGGAGTVAALAYLKVIDPAKLAFWRKQGGRSHRLRFPFPSVLERFLRLQKFRRIFMSIRRPASRWCIIISRWRRFRRGSSPTHEDSRPSHGTRKVSRRSSSWKTIFCPRARVRACRAARREGKLAITFDASTLKGCV